MSSLFLSSTILALSLAHPPHEMQSSNKPVPGAKAIFDEVNRLVAEKYVDPAPTEDEVWTSAIHGVLDRLIQTKGIKVNALLDPDQLVELEGHMSGNVVGVGVSIKMFEGVVFVRSVIADSSAAKAGLMKGDRILAVDKKPLKDLPLSEIVGLIRGAEGTTVDLTIQREAKDWVEPLTRHSLKWDSVTGKMLGDKLGYVRIHVFNKSTPAQLDRVLSGAVKGADALVLDVRDCPGGLFEESLMVADRFLPPGAPIVKLLHRGGKEDIQRASKRDATDRVPMVVLIDNDTASSAEILAAALADNDRAKLIGETTLGKGTVETVLKLSNGWGLKLTVARFVSPKGKSWQGKGLEPDLPIAHSASDDLEIPLESDPQVKAATTLLSLRAR